MEEKKELLEKELKEEELDKVAGGGERRDWWTCGECSHTWKAGVLTTFVCPSCGSGNIHL